MTDHQIIFDCICIGDLHSWLLHEGSGQVGKTLNAFDTTINIRTNKDELLVITTAKLFSPVNLNVTTSYANMSFKQLVREFANVRMENGNIGKQPGTSLLIEDAVIMLAQHDSFRNNFGCLKPGAIQTFEKNSRRIFSAIKSQAEANRFGCLLNPDVTTRGLFTGFIDNVISNNQILDLHEFYVRISKGLQQLCGKGPGFTPAGDDFIAGYLAMSNWLSKEFKLGESIIPGSDFSVLTTWTSFKLIEYGARNLLDDQAQHMINCVANGDIDAYIQAVGLICKRGHTSGIDFATGMTIAAFTASDRLLGTSALDSLAPILDS